MFEIGIFKKKLKIIYILFIHTCNTKIYEYFIWLISYISIIYVRFYHFCVTELFVYWILFIFLTWSKWCIKRKEENLKIGFSKQINQSFLWHDSVKQDMWINPGKIGIEFGHQNEKLKMKFDTKSIF